MPELAARDFELAYEARLALPNVAMLNHGSGLMDRLLEQLVPFQARLGDLLIETASPDLTRAHFACNVFGFSGIVRTYADRVEVRCVDEPANEQLLAIAEAATRAVASVQTGGSFVLASHTFALAVHCEPKEVTAKEFLQGLAHPRMLGGEEPTSSSVSFTFGQNGPRLSAFIGVEPSAQIAGGIFLRLVGTYDARSVQLRPAAAAAIELVKQVQHEILGVNLSDVHFSAD